MKGDPPIRLYLAAAVRDAPGSVHGKRGVNAAPGAVATQGGRIVAAGTPDDVRRAVGREQVAEVVDTYRECLLLPAMVNAHAHLDLTSLGPRPWSGDFGAWLRTISAERPTDPAAVRAAVLEGVRQSRAAGVEFVGDIACGVDAVAARQAAGLPGVSYVEVLGLAGRQAERLAQLEERLETLPFEAPCPGHQRGAVVGLAPHAPYSVGRDVFEAVTKLSENRAYRVSTHAAETPEELAFLRDGSGPYAAHVKHYGYTDADIAAHASGLHPIDHLEPYLKRGRWLLAHCNYLHDEHVRLLKRTGTSVAYCPVASDYFGHHTEDGDRHRYRELLEAGVNVCLGTDSILCQPPTAEQPHPMSILAQMRHLWRRDRTPADLLLAMATVNGMIGLEFGEDEVTFTRGAPALFSSVWIDVDDETDPLEQALTNLHPVVAIRDPDFGHAIHA